MERIDINTNVLMIPPFPEEAEYLRCHSYKIRVRMPSGEWSDITPYEVRIDPDYVQNMTSEDVFLNSPMVYFDFEGVVEAEIEKIGHSIFAAKVHPESKAIPVEFRDDGKIRFTLHESSPICVSINGNRQDMVYLMVRRPQEDLPDINDPNVCYIGPGVTKTGTTETEVWNGMIIKPEIYESDLSDEYIEKLAGIIPGDDATSGDSYEFDGYSGYALIEDTLDLGKEDLGVSVWVYRKSDRTQTVRTIISGYLSLRSDGRPTTPIGEWMYPLSADKSISTDKWDHIYLKKKGDVFTFYVNGQKCGSMSRVYDKELKLGVRLGSAGTIEALTLKDGQTLYLAPGAVLSGAVLGYAVSNVRICGRGIIDLSRTSHKEKSVGIGLFGCKNVVIDGVIVNDPKSITIHLCESHNVNIRNYASFSSYGATDGVHLKSSSDVDICDSFIRSNDDTIAIYGSIVAYRGSSRNISVRDCTLISDAGHVIMSGIHAAAYENERLSGFRFSNLDILDSKCQYDEYQGVFGLNAGNDAVIEDVVFKNIRIEEINRNQLFNLRIFNNPTYCVSPGASIRNILFSDIYYNGEYKPHIIASRINGENKERLVESVEFRNIRINGQRCATFEEVDIEIGEFTKDISIS